MQNTLFLKIHIILIVISHWNWNAILYWHTANIYRLLKFCRLQKILLFTLNLTKGWFIIFALSVLQINNANCLKFSILQNPQTAHRNVNFNFFKNICDIRQRVLPIIQNYTSFIISAINMMEIIIDYTFLSFQQSTWRRSCWPEIAQSTHIVWMGELVHFTLQSERCLVGRLKIRCKDIFFERYIMI